jgi:hypothetical protein
MKPPHNIGAVCVAMMLAACSGAQSGSIANPVPAVGAPLTSSTSVVADSVSKDRHLAGAERATTGLILVANENTGLGGSIREYAEGADGNAAPSTVISHINGPTPSPSVQQKASALQTATSRRAARPRSKRSGWPAIC